MNNVLALSRTHGSSSASLRLSFSSYQRLTCFSQSANPDPSTQDLFHQIKQRFLSFKEHKFKRQEYHFKRLANLQTPKFMVIGCADSRVCPSNILGFQPGEAFMVRNVANLVPPAENGPTETNAALEFGTLTLKVEHVLVIGHSNCAGIEALVRMKDDQASSLIEKWVSNAKAAKSSYRTDEDFQTQCRLCEKESINQSLMNLLTYPLIAQRVREGLLSVHGGYYNFLDCSFEKWTLDIERKGCSLVKDWEMWT